MSKPSVKTNCPDCGQEHELHESGVWASMSFQCSCGTALYWTPWAADPLLCSESFAELSPPEGTPLSEVVFVSTADLSAFPNSVQKVPVQYSLTPITSAKEG